jgi:hypothetical protein
VKLLLKLSLSNKDDPVRVVSAIANTNKYKKLSPLELSFRKEEAKLSLESLKNFFHDNTFSLFLINSFFLLFSSIEGITTA